MGVSCVTTRSCAVVGDATFRRPAGSAPAGGCGCPPAVNIVGRWNGSTLGLGRGPGGPANTRLSHVSCASVTFCVAVGTWSTAAIASSSFEFGGQVLAYDGRSWHRVPIKNVAATRPFTLTGVSCAAVHACEVVGTSASPRLTISYAGFTDGTSLTPQPVRSSLGRAFLLAGLNAVACFTPHRCEAVGGARDTAAGEKTPVEATYADGSWTLSKLPPLPHDPVPALGAIGCTAPRSCIATHGILDGSVYSTVVATLP